MKSQITEIFKCHNQTVLVHARHDFTVFSIVQEHHTQMSENLSDLS